MFQDTNTDLTLKLQYIIRNITYYRHMNGRATIIQPSREAHTSIYTNIYLLNYTKVVAFFYLAQCKFFGGLQGQEQEILLESPLTNSWMPVVNIYSIISIHKTTVNS